MNKKIKIIIGLSIVSLIILLVILFTIFNNPKDSSDITIADNVDESSVTKDGIYTEKGTENIVDIVKLAVENYAYQNKTETKDARNKRLAKYFSQDSPMYEYSQDNIESGVNKSTSKLTSIYGCVDQEIENGWCIEAVANNTFYLDSGSYSKLQTYFIILNKTKSESYEVYDIGELQ